MATFTVWFHNHTSFGSRVIQLWTWCKYMHSEIQIDNISYNAGTSGTIKTENMKFDKRWVGYSIEVTEEQKNSIIAFCEGELGSEYDWYGLFMAQLFGSTREHPTKWFCSEFATAVTHIVAPDITSEPFSHWTPKDLYKTIKASNKFKQVSA